MAMIPRLSPPETLGAALAPLATVSDADFERLRRAILTRRSFQIQPKLVKELAEEAPGLSVNLTFLLGALSFLYGRLEPYRDKTPLTAIVTQLVEDFEVKCDEAHRQILERRLTQLLERNNAYDISKKMRRLERGFLPNAISFRSFVDLRPDFGGEDAVSFKGLLKIIQFRIRTDAESKRDKEFVFQISEDALDELQQAIDRARTKLQTLDQISNISENYITRVDI